MNGLKKVQTLLSLVLQIDHGILVQGCTTVIKSPELPEMASRAAALVL